MRNSPRPARTFFSNQIDNLGLAGYTIGISASKFMNATQPTTAPVVRALYVATDPLGTATNFFESKNWRVTNVHNLQELDTHLVTLKQQEVEKLPLVVLFGHLDELVDHPKGLNAHKVVERIAKEAGEIIGLIPFAPTSSPNADLFNWTVEERQKIGLEKLQIIGFGSEPERPLRAFAANKQEGAYSDLAIVLGLTSPQHKERGRG